MSFELSVSLKLTVVFAIGGLLALLLRQASASVRHAVWALAFWAALALPLVSRVLPAIEFPVLPRSEIEAQAQPPDRSFPMPIVESASLLVLKKAPPVTMSNLSQPREWTWREFVAAVWGTGALVLMLRALWGLWEVRRLKRSAAPVADEVWKDLVAELTNHFGISRPLEILTSTVPVAPMTWGVFRHTILMPEVAKDWTDSRLRSVLAHELAHVKRGDGLTQILVQTVRSLYWFNPLVWYGAHRLRIERERACDDQVLKLGVDADDYADHLLQIAREVNSPFSFASVSMAHPSQLESRLLAILNPRIRRKALSGIAAGALFVFIALLTVSVAGIQLTALAGLAPLPRASAPAVPSMTPESAQSPAAIDPSTAGSIQGRVVRAGTSEGLSKATVELIPAAVASLSDLDFNPAVLEFAKTRSGYLSATTNERGEFTFDKVAPGRYRLESRHYRFSLVPSNAVIEVQTGISKRGVMVAMAPAAAITGIVRDESDKLIAYAVVSALGVSYRPGGGRFLHIVETIETNDLGEYRLYGLSPGEYYISVDNSDSATHDPGMRRQNIVSADKRYPVFYYPDTPELGVAKAVRVRDSGLDVGGIDIRMKQVPTATVRGVVQTAGLSATSGALPAINLVFTPAMFPDASPGYRYQADSSGKFEIKDVVPGSYLLNAWGLSRTPNTPSLHSSMVRVDVAGKDIEGLVLPMIYGPTISGSVRVDGVAGPLPFDPAAVLLRFVGRVGTGMGLYGGDGFNGSISPDGNYTTARGAGSFPGDFDITILGLPPEFYLKEPLTLQIPGSGAPASIALDITLGHHRGIATGVVTGADGRPAPGAKVVLIPAEKFQRRADRYPRAVTDSDGKFRIVSAPPGDYTAYAFEDVAGDTQYSPEFVRAYPGRGSRIPIVENGDASVNLRLIPMERQ